MFPINFFVLKESSKYNCDLVFELFRDICRLYSSLLLHLSKEYIWFLLSSGDHTWREHRKCGYFYKALLSKISELYLSTGSKNNVACYSNLIVIAFVMPFSLKSCPTWLTPWLARILLHKDFLSILVCLLNQMTCEVMAGYIWKFAQRHSPFLGFRWRYHILFVYQARIFHFSFFSVSHKSLSFITWNLIEYLHTQDFREQRHIWTSERVFYCVISVKTRHARSKLYSNKRGVKS